MKKEGWIDGAPRSFIHKIHKLIHCYIEISLVAHSVKNPPASAADTRDTGSIPGSRRSPGVGNGNLLQYFCLENATDKGDWQAMVGESQRVRHSGETEHACALSAGNWPGSFRSHHTPSPRDVKALFSVQSLSRFRLFVTP